VTSETIAVCAEVGVCRVVERVLGWVGRVNIGEE